MAAVLGPKPVPKMAKNEPCAIEEFGSGARLKLPALLIWVIVGCADPTAANSPTLRTMARIVFTLFSFLGLMSLTPLAPG